mmetsp:Transcript_100345/g.289758  ORF Transcript_100345/g.289758 Transcript_100345/m.289758 type:complete len:204 (+) Transcript_100345:1710-2321(+)
MGFGTAIGRRVCQGSRRHPRQLRRCHRCLRAHRRAARGPRYLGRSREPCLSGRGQPRSAANARCGCIGSSWSGQARRRCSSSPTDAGLVAAFRVALGYTGDGMVDPWRGVPLVRRVAGLAGGDEVRRTAFVGPRAGRRDVHGLRRASGSTWWRRCVDGSCANRRGHFGARLAFARRRLGLGRCGNFQRCQCGRRRCCCGRERA